MPDEMEDEKLRHYADACFASCYPPVDAVVHAILAERARCLKIVEERCEGDMDFAAFLIKKPPSEEDKPHA